MAVSRPLQKLELLDSAKAHEFIVPVKKINDGDDVQFWLKSKAYTDIMTFVLQLNFSMFPQKFSSGDIIETFELEPPGQTANLSAVVLSLQDLVSKLEKIIDEAPPDPGPRRFGNVSFRKWYEIVESRLPKLLDEHLPEVVLSFGSNQSTEVLSKSELTSYLLGSFGSAQRLDYGTGHELSFLAFIACIWRLGGFPSSTSPGFEERGIVRGVIAP
jgi:serine/threonine-protein phosphatase 2A activator